MSEQKTQREIAADVLIAWTQHLPAAISAERWSELTPKIAEAYKTIYAAVQSPTAE